MKVPAPSEQNLLRPISIGQILMIVACGLLLAEIIEFALDREHISTLQPGWLAHFSGEIVTLLLVFFVLFRPIRRRTQQRQELIRALQVSEDQYRTLVEGLDLGVALIDGDFNVIRANRAMERFQGQPACFGNRLKCYELLQHSGCKTCTSCPVEQTLKSQQPAMAEMHLPESDTGKVRDVRVRTFPVESAAGRQFIEVVEDITEEYRAREEIQRLSRELHSAAEEERKRLARDLHDQCGQVLAGVQYSLEALRTEVAETLPELSRQFDRISSMVEQIGDNIRQVSTRLRPSALDDLGLKATLNWLAEDLRRQRPGLELVVEAEDLPENLATDVETSLYRICQEGLNNVLKHSNASRVKVTLKQEMHNVSLTIVDDGCGFPQEETMEQAMRSGRLGLRGMRERVAALGGTFRLDTQPGAGVRVEVSIPVAGEVVHG